MSWHLLKLLAVSSASHYLFRSGDLLLGYVLWKKLFKFKFDFIYKKTDKMKKYQQLLLAILSIVSFSCLLIYRHEYNKLRYVLEVLNFFGTPGTTYTKTAVTSLDPLPAWQRISNSLYIYSAYWDKTDDKGHVVALAVGVLNENLNYGCYLYFNSIPNTKMGQFSFSGLSYKNPDSSFNKSPGKSKTKGFVFYCEAESVGDVPVGVVFFKTGINESSQGFIPVISLQSNPAPKNSTGICIMPSLFSNFSKSTYLEFLSFHKIVGVNNFIAYGANDQYNLLSLIQQDPAHKINITILRWNYPFFGDFELSKVIAENDCKIRTKGIFENVLVLEWNKFFVPRYVFTINKILNELDLLKKVFKFQISTLLFCSEYEDNVKSNILTPYVFRKTKYAFPKTDMLVPIYRPYLKNGPVQKISKDIAVIQQYASCRDFKIKSGEKKVGRTDLSIYKFENEFINSELLKL